MIKKSLPLVFATLLTFACSDDAPISPPTGTGAAGPGSGGGLAGGAPGAGGFMPGSGGAATGGVGIGGAATGGAATGGDGAGGAATGGDGAGGSDPETMEWLPSWATTIQTTEPGANSPPTLDNNTLRQFVWPTVSGNQIRIELSNEKGATAVDIQKVHIAMAKTADDPGDSKGQIDTTTDTPFTFSGMPNVSIPAGQTAWSDPLDFPLEEIKLTAITMQFGANVPSAITGHPGARTTSYVQTGDAVATEGVSGETRDRWYFIDSIEVMAPTNAYAIAILGDSISDGYGVLNQFGRWPDFMTSKIKSDPAIATTRSVLNFGMGANELTRSSQYQDAGVERFRRDVLSRDKIRWLIVLEGINDINNGIGADAITSTYEDIISEAQQAGILVYLSPLTPDGDTGTRAQVNTWIRGTGASLYDAMIDLETPISDGSNSIAQQYKRSDGDNLHPDVSGYQAMGESVDLSLFYDTTLQ